jgi:adenylate kinase family enzyme
MQELMAYAGQLDCYIASNEILSKFLNIEVSVMQVHRVTDTYGALLEQEAMLCQKPETAVCVKQGEAVYAMTDGSMLLTREDSWSEVKLGRIFSQSDCMEINDKRGWIKNSSYEAYLGSSKTFTRRFEQKLDAYSYLNEKLIFITDGALWIKNWIEDAYPKATQILDWYHACEHLCEFAKEYFKEDGQRNDWIEQQKELLYESKMDEVISNIQSLPVNKKVEQINKDNLLQYYQSNKNRMDYKKYRTMGAGLIGSGAIESAHRTLIQKRMKLSGQRWSKKRAQNMLTLRCTRLSGKWDKVIKLICSPPIAA